MQALENPEGVAYQQDTLSRYEVREYVLEKWGRKCICCDKDGVPLQVEHLQAKARPAATGYPTGGVVVQGISHIRCRVLQRVDDYGYTAQAKDRVEKGTERGRALRDALSLPGPRTEVSHAIG